ncbi:MAG TPA: NAD-dependent epimerase/dehydratase family protein [Gemmatimonadales bacterium]|jgi:UDP-glucose 4-epimerase|nr:NAD-dependent epimerase/dehydratase family protein [Gemmatimonadales bacterium]
MTAGGNPWDQLAAFDGQRILVTGGAGFIGSATVARLLELGASVTVLDDFFTGQAENLPAPGPRLQIIWGSVVEEPTIQELVGNADYVFHMAARNIIVSTKNPREDFATNIGGTLNVLLAARASRVRRVIYASSASVYGNPRRLPINEDDATNMLSPYAVSKYGGENYCTAFFESYGVPVTSVRYSNVYGPSQRPENPYCGVVAKFFAAALAGQPPVIHGDGEQTRDYTYVGDAVEATLLAAVSPRADGQVYNVGTGRETSVNQLAQAILKITGRDTQPQHIDRRDIDNIRRRVLNMEKARRELRFTPEITLEAGLRATYDWLLRQQGWHGPAQVLSHDASKQVVPESTPAT